ncbi:hypothetical protein C8Q79DRAFT_109891 [Trametes meyenii]|nr:hypothetical protein C8Q79DRAFT_109891 [Trametes meyenii]
MEAQCIPGPTGLQMHHSKGLSWGHWCRPSPGHCRLRINRRPAHAMVTPFDILWTCIAVAVLALTQPKGVSAKNVTIDDSAPEGVLYLPSESYWSVGLSCSFCALHPDATQAYNKTWHVVVYDPGELAVPQVDISFTGNSVYVYAILADTIPGGLNTTDPTRVDFLIDGAQVGSFIHNPGPQPRFLYNQLIYANQSLKNGDHLIAIKPKTDASSIIFFDYVIYGAAEPEIPGPSSDAGGSKATSIVGTAALPANTSPQLSGASTPAPLPSDGSTSTGTTTSPNATSASNGVLGPSSTPKTPIIAGAVVGVVAFLCALGLAACWIVRRRRRRPSAVTPFEVSDLGPDMREDVPHVPSLPDPFADSPASSILAPAPAQNMSILSAVDEIQEEARTPSTSRSRSSRWADGERGVTRSRSPRSTAAATYTPTDPTPALNRAPSPAHRLSPEDGNPASNSTNGVASSPASPAPEHPPTPPPVSSPRSPLHSPLTPPTPLPASSTVPAPTPANAKSSIRAELAALRNEVARLREAQSVPVPIPVLGPEMDPDEPPPRYVDAQ